jgi:hypothetical protein
MFFDLYSQGIVTDPDWSNRVKIRTQGKTKSYLANELAKLQLFHLEQETGVRQVDKSKQRQIPVIVFMFGGGEFSLQTLEVAMKMGFSAIIVQDTGRAADLIHAWYTDAKKNTGCEAGSQHRHRSHQYSSSSSSGGSSSSGESEADESDENEGSVPAGVGLSPGSRARIATMKDSLKSHIKGFHETYKSHKRKQDTSEFRKFRHLRTKKRWELVRFQLLNARRRERWIQQHLSPDPDIFVETANLSKKDMKKKRLKYRSASSSIGSDSYRDDDEDEHSRQLVPKLPLKLQRLADLYTNGKGKIDMAKAYKAEMSLVWMCSRFMTQRNRCFFFDLRDDGTVVSRKGGASQQAGMRRGEENGNGNQLMRQVQECLANNPTLDDDSELWLAVKWNSLKAVVQKLESSTMTSEKDLVGELLVYAAFHDLGTIFSYLTGEGLGAANLDPLVHRDINEFLGRTDGWVNLAHLGAVTRKGAGGIFHAVQDIVGVGDAESDTDESDDRDMARHSSYASNFKGKRGNKRVRSLLLWPCSINLGRLRGIRY